MKISKIVPLRIPTLVLLLGLLIQACEDHRQSVNPSDYELPGFMVYALNDNNTVYRIDTRKPWIMMDSIKLETRDPGEKIVAIDARPTTGEIFAISDNDIVYVVNTTGYRVRRPVFIFYKLGLDVDLSKTTVGFDIDPVKDRMRIVTGKGANVLARLEDGQIEGRGVSTPDVGAVAYSNNYPGATSTSLFGMDAHADKLVRYEDPDAGSITTVGNFGIDVEEVGGFDISTTTSFGDQFGIASIRYEGKWELDYVNLKTGKLQKIGDLPKRKIIGVVIPANVAYAINDGNTLLTFNPVGSIDEDGDIRETRIKGLPNGVKLLGIDFNVSPLTKLYALASDSKIYQINPGTGEAKMSCKLDLTINLSADPGFGVSFEPFSNEMRVMTSDGLFFSADVETGRVTELNPLYYPAGKVKGLDAMAYANSQPGLEKPYDYTFLFGIDRETNVILRQPSASNNLKKEGTLNISGKIDKVNGFDFGGYSEFAYGILKVDGETRFYKINAVTGQTESSRFKYNNVGGLAMGYNFYNMPY
ncbi:MAG: DUF4394 domain-containing protein [Dyadobacter sp.]|uniref:DUF4394 domain-containing protein n=1 Tax=Dyadobacter sp. TaxID=1914288 RepID=UPI00326477A9